MEDTRPMIQPFPYLVTSYDGDKKRRLRLSSQMRLQQEAGERHLLAGGYPYRRLYELGFVFVVTKINSVIHRAPIFGDEIVVSTWTSGPKGSQYYRCFEFCDLNGNILIESSAAYAVVDVHDHKLLRPSVVSELDIVRTCDKKVSCPDPAKIRLPENMQTSGHREIRFSDVDYNEHLNNTIYADFISDFLPGGMDGLRIAAFSINYLGEAVEGDCLQIQTAVVGDEVFYEGAHARGKCFTAWAKVEKDTII